MKKSILVASAVLAVLVAVAGAAYFVYMRRAAQDPGFFDGEIEAFVEADRVHPPRKELFRFDGLHLSADGYAAWTSVVAPVLRADLGVSGPS